jgi:hypothetical protein
VEQDINAIKPLRDFVLENIPENIKVVEIAQEDLLTRKDAVENLMTQ